jgi:hypothetical protein
MLRIQDLDGVFLDSRRALRISERQFRETRRAWCERGDLLVSIGGELRLAGIVVDSANQTIGQHTGLLPIDRDLVVNEFALAYLTSQSGKTDLSRYMAGSAQLGIDLDDLREIRIPIPSREIQNGIANKIAKAERLRELAKRARTAFMQWMTSATCSEELESNSLELLGHVPAGTRSDATWTSDFDPADRVDPWPQHIASRTIRSHLKELKSLQFPSFFEIATSERGRLKPPLAPDCFFISVLDVAPHGSVDWGNAAKSRYESSGTLVFPGDILYSTLNPQEPRVAVIPRDLNATVVCSPEFSILRIKSQYERFPNLLAALLRSLWIRVQASFLTRSSSLSRRRLDENDLHKLYVPWKEDGTSDLEVLLAASLTADDECESLVREAQLDIEDLLSGNLDETKLMSESADLEKWLSINTNNY